MMAQHSIDNNDPDLAGLFTEVSRAEGEGEFVRCSKKQREHLDWIMRMKCLTYKQLVKECVKECGRDMKGIGEMSRAEATRVIFRLNGNRGE